MDAIKVFISFIISALFTVLHPLLNPVIILVILFVFDIFVGILADKMINKVGFSFSKFLKSITFLLFYVVIIAIIHTICYLQYDVQEGLLLIKTITYVCSYFYFSNITKNLHESYPKNRFFAFLYFVLSVDILTSKIPILQKFIQSEKQNENGKN